MTRFQLFSSFRRERKRSGRSWNFSMVFSSDWKRFLRAKLNEMERGEREVFRIWMTGMSCTRHRVNSLLRVNYFSICRFRLPHLPFFSWSFLADLKMKKRFRWSRGVRPVRTRVRASASPDSQNWWLQDRNETLCLWLCVSFLCVALTVIIRPPCLGQCCERRGYLAESGDSFVSPPQARPYRMTRRSKSGWKSSFGRFSTVSS